MKQMLSRIVVFMHLLVQYNGTQLNSLRKFPTPAGLCFPLKTEFRDAFDVGPPEPYPRSKASLGLPLLLQHEPLVDKLLQDIKEGLQHVFQTQNNWTFAIPGSGSTGCFAVLDNLIIPGDKTLVLISGYWGGVMADMSERLGAQVIRANKSPGTAFSLPEIKTYMAIHRPQLLLLVHGESSTGVHQPLDEIGDLCVQYDALLVVDTVASAGIQPILMGANKIDAVFTSSYKGLGSINGLAAVSLSERAVRKIQNRKTMPRAYQTDFKLQYELWNTSNVTRVRHMSLSMPLLYALREGLATIVEEGLENAFKRHQNVTAHLIQGLNDLSLRQYVENPGHRLVGVTTVRAPVGKEAAKVVDYMLRRYNIAIAPGFEPATGNILRFGIYAGNADIRKVNKLLLALKSALESKETNS